MIPPLDRVLEIGRDGFGYRNPVKIPNPTPGKNEQMEISLPSLDNKVSAEGCEISARRLGNILPSLEGGQ